MSLRVTPHPDAETELREAAHWYEQQHAGLGLRLLDAVDDARRSARRRSRPRPRARDPVVVLTQLIPHDPFSWTHLRVRQSFIARGLTDQRIAARLRSEYTRLHRRLGDALQREQQEGMIHPDADSVGLAARLVAHAEGLANHVLLGVTTPEHAHAAVLASLEEHRPPGPRPALTQP